MDEKAKATADWLVRVLNEAETLPVATNLNVRQQAYMLAEDGMPRRQILFHFVNDLFFTGDIDAEATEWDRHQRRVAGLYVSGNT